MKSIQKPIQLSKEHIPEAAKILTTSFYDYPFWSYIYPDESKRLENLYVTFEMSVRHGLRYGKVYATSTNFEGVSIWINSQDFFILLFS